MPRLIKWRMSIGFPAADRIGEVEVDDDATDEQIDDMVREDATNFLEISWEAA